MTQKGKDECWKRNNDLLQRKIDGNSLRRGKYWPRHFASAFWFAVIDYTLDYTYIKIIKVSKFQEDLLGHRRIVPKYFNKLEKHTLKRSQKISIFVPEIIHIFSFPRYYLVKSWINNSSKRFSIQHILPRFTYASSLNLPISTQPAAR